MPHDSCLTEVVANAGRLTIRVPDGDGLKSPRLERGRLLPVKTPNAVERSAPFCPICEFFSLAATASSNSPVQFPPDLNAVAGKSLPRFDASVRPTDAFSSVYPRARLPFISMHRLLRRWWRLDLNSVIYYFNRSCRNMSRHRAELDWLVGPD